MSYITGLNSIVKGERGELFFDKEQFLFATNFASNPHFADDLNWAKIAIHYKDATSGQRQVVILMDDHGRGWFSPSPMARSGNWSVDKIEVYDKQGDSFLVSRANMPSSSTFDIAVQRIVAPSPSVQNIIETAELVSNGQFDKNINGWTSLAGAAWKPGATGEEIREPAVGERYSETDKFFVNYMLGWGQVVWDGQIVYSGSHSGSSVAVDNYTYYLGSFKKMGESPDGFDPDEYAVYRTFVPVSSGSAQQSPVNPELERGFLKSIPTVPGLTYSYSFEIVEAGADGVDLIISSGSWNNYAEASDPSRRIASRSSVPVGTFTGSFVANSSSVTFHITSANPSQTIVFDNVSVKRVPDRVELAPNAIAGFEIGYKAKLWDDVAGAFLSSEIYEIVDILKQETKDIVIFDKQIVGDYAGKTLRLRFPSYSEVSGKQASLYQYVGSGY